MDRLIGKYNRPENVLFISSYPEKRARYSQKVCAVGGFTKNTIQALQTQNPKTNYVVVTVKIDGKQEIYEEDGILILRVLDRDNPLSYFPTIRQLFAFDKIKRIVTEFEFGSFGGIQNASLFLIVPLILKLIGKKQVFVMHQVIENLDELTGHLGWSLNDPRKYVYNPLLRIFYTLVYHVCDRLVVTEEVFKKRLQAIVHKLDKVITIPHGVDTHLPVIEPNTAKKALGIAPDKKVILYFGYLSWYKGADLFFKYAKKMANPDYHFVLAGGPSFTNVHKPHYKKYLDLFINPPKNIQITGFVPEDKMSLYFSAADLVVLPYRTMMSSSGPLSLAFSFEKPLIMSEKMKEYVFTHDFSSILKKLGLKTSDLFFPLTTKNFEEKVLTHKEHLLSAFSSQMKGARSHDNIAKYYSKLINELLIINTKADTMNKYAFRLKF